MADKKFFSNRVTNFIALTITLVWAASFIADILLPGYAPSPLVHALMMTIAGAAVGKSFISSNGGGDES